MPAYRQGASRRTSSSSPRGCPTAPSRRGRRKCWREIILREIVFTGYRGIKAQFDDGTLTVRTLRAAVAESLGVEEAAVKRS